MSEIGTTSAGEPDEPRPRDEAVAQPAGPGTPAGDRDAVRGAATVPRTRTSAAFKSLLGGAVVLVLLLIFILENTARTRISYFGASAHMPLGVGLLLAAVAGALVVGIAGGARIVQLRRRIRHGHRH